MLEIIAIVIGVIVGLSLVLMLCIVKIREENRVIDGINKRNAEYMQNTLDRINAKNNR